MAAGQAVQAGHRRSIRTRLLRALLLLSLLPLLLLLALGLAGSRGFRGHIKSELVEEARTSLLRLAMDQAAIAGAMLDRVEAEADLLAYSVPGLLQGVSVSGAGPVARSFRTWTAGSGIPLEAVRAQAEHLDRLEGLFVRVREGNANLDAVYFGTPSGLFCNIPWPPDESTSWEFLLEPEHSRGLADGRVSEPLRQAFARNELTLSDQAHISTLEAGRLWLISDIGSRQTFSLRQVETGIDVYLEFDPRLRPWYTGALGAEGLAWSKYDDWSREDSLFALDAALESSIGDRVTPALAQAFIGHQVVLVEGDAITLDELWGWRLKDRNRKNYKIVRVDDSLVVHGIDVLTCSRAVHDPAGRLLGVLGVDIGMATLSRAIIRTPEDIEGYAFLLDPAGVLVEQESAAAYVPPEGDGIRRSMVAGETDIRFDAGHAVYVAFAPLRQAQVAPGTPCWSLGISMPEAEITRLADNIHHQLTWALLLLAGFIAAMILLVAGVAPRLSAGITGPILALDEGAKLLGTGNLEHRLEIRTGDEIEELAGTFNRMAGALESYIEDLRRTTAEKERFASELRVAHDIQMSFLKKDFPAFPQRSDFSLFAALEPAREVGGDLYDFALLDDGRLVFYIGDVSDKGVPAALVMAMTMTLMKRAWQRPGCTPAGILAEVNTALAEDNVNVMFVTLFLGILDVESGELLFSNAGHNPPLILDAAGGCRYLTLPEGLVLGVMTEAGYHDDRVRLEPGDMIVAYTDGVTEAMNTARQLYSEERLLATTAALTGRDVTGTVSGVFADVKAHAAGAPPSDDIAVLALRRS